ncbi:MAG: hypothetical protein WDM92_09570 [Caulobacteraceae bacterium]
MRRACSARRSWPWRSSTTSSTARAAFDLSRLDEAFQEERWGVDAEAAQRTAAMGAEAVMLERWFAALR